MKPHTALALFVVLCIGILIGRVSSPSGVSERDPDDAAETGPRRTRVADRESTPAPNTPFARLRKEIRAAPADQCGALLRKALETPDPFERRALIDELMVRMDASNFLEMSLATARISRETGRDLQADWLLIHTRVGQVAGPQAMARWIEHSALGSQPAERTLWGWATQDPEAARKWLDGNPEMHAHLPLDPRRSRARNGGPPIWHLP